MRLARDQAWRAARGHPRVPLSIKAFDLELGGVVELAAVGAEQLEAVVVVRVVRGGDHDAEVGAQAARHHRHARRRQRAEQAHVHADGGEAGHKRGLQHVAGQARVLADHDEVPAIAAVAEISLPAARPRRSAVSAVIGGVFAVPRTPSVPK